MKHGRGCTRSDVTHGIYSARGIFKTYDREVLGALACGTLRPGPGFRPGLTRMSLGFFTMHTDACDGLIRQLTGLPGSPDAVPRANWKNTVVTSSAGGPSYTECAGRDQQEVNKTLPRTWKRGSMGNGVT